VKQASTYFFSSPLPRPLSSFLLKVVVCPPEGHLFPFGRRCGVFFFPSLFPLSLFLIYRLLGRWKCGRVISRAGSRSFWFHSWFRVCIVWSTSSSVFGLFRAYKEDVRHAPSLFHLANPPLTFRFSCSGRPGVSDYFISRLRPLTFPSYIMKNPIPCVLRFPSVSGVSVKSNL